MGARRVWRPVVRVAAAGGGAAVVTAALCAVMQQPADATTTPLLRGHVVNTSGRADRGMTIQVEAWPTGAVLDALPDGASVPTRVVQTLHPDASGNYAVNPDISKLGSRYTEPGGTVNLDVTTTDATPERNSESASFTAAVPNSRAAAENPLVATTSRPQHVGFDLAKSTLSTAIGSARMTTARTTTSRDVSADSLKPALRSNGVTPLVDQGCHPDWFKEKSFPKRSESFLDLWTVGRATVDEEVGSSHSLGVGVAVSGSHWSASGSVTVETHSSAGGSNDYSHNYQLRNYVNYGHYKRLCFKLNKKGQTVGYYRHRVSATSMHSLLVGGTRIKDHVWGDTRKQWRPKCTRYTSGRFHKTKGGNIDFEAGVNAPYISLHARASFSHDTTVTWRPPKSGSWLCGNSDKGWASARYAGEDKNPGPSKGGCGAKCKIVSATKRQH